ncbi:MMPL family transporter [Mycolicibacterium sp. CBMA 361]|uniref:MMPL family transporter n=1 Tax=Mycolicibacterium sp. CBMA 361 TaxID=2606610 RepID=UPI0012DEA83B|nr:MMPL family transporter [Mycolicibacterium sp. CBMA 361]MUM31145.1 MMPL family transporter [Mycolicibacterium sp. CBMA 361]
MLNRVALLAIAAPRRILALAGLILIAAAIFGVPVVKTLPAGGFQDPKSESSEAGRLLTTKFHQGDMPMLVTVTAADGVHGPGATAAGLDIVDHLKASPHVAYVSSAWTVPPAAAGELISKDGKSGLIVAGMNGGENNAQKYAQELADQVVHNRPGITVKAGGGAMVYSQINTQTEHDLLLMESIAVPLSFLVLVWVFGGLVAAALPILVGGLAMTGTLAVLRTITFFTDVSVFALNIATALGLALAIDYTLLIISRYRDEVADGQPRDRALTRTMVTAGRTVLFSATTVGLSMAAMLMFPMYFLTSIAYAGIATVVFAAAAAVIVTPALVLGAPFLGAKWGFPDDQVLPTSASAHQVGDELRTNFTNNSATNVTAVIPDAAGLTPTAFDTYAAEVSRVAAVTQVSAPTGTFVGGLKVGPAGAGAGIADGSAFLTIGSSAPLFSDASQAQLDAVHAVKGPDGRTVQLAGTAQISHDSVQAVIDRLPWVLAAIAVIMFGLLFLLTGSVVLPLKAIVLNVLSLTAAFGSLVWIFQDGHLNALGTTATGTLASNMPILLFCIAFGLSMDYEVFLVARIREFWLTEQDNDESVALGLAHTGRVITAAALVMSISFGALIAAQVSFMRMFGLGLTIAVLVDATLVRTVLVPAFMHLMGRWNWWAPAPLAWLHQRIGISESGAADPPVPSACGAQ